ncbi:GMP reductase [Spirochaetales bacterium BR151]|uniref:GMP reductase n=2 Tax=Entomospira culicis TaxID=2719989 RepID=A0A968KV82_9SPIO|nr:GMP reductase [Entomospira culicis]NIZ69890.1 GMP reductase [Entomospira culicis]WDI36995.1 GMP reductase [Entomospira culicis]
MRIIDDVKLDFKDVLFMPKRSTLSSRKQVSLERTYTFKHSQKQWQGVPIMAANMDGVGTVSMAKALASHKLFTTLVKSVSAEEITQLAQTISPHHFAVSTGTGEADWQRLQDILRDNPHITFICIDVANGYSESFGDFVAKVRNLYPNHTIMAGNVVTADMTQELILRGADIVKVGIGPGSVCTTRKQTGVGYPQLSAIIECADAAHGLGGHIIADGGCTNPGDVAKAFGAGADFVMLGGMLAGHDEGEGQLIEEHHLTQQLDQATQQPIIETKRFVQFYGMSSDTAMKKHHGGVAEYRSSEGKTVKIPYRGAVQATILDLLGGIRSTCTYVGAQNLKQLSKCTTFVRVTQQINNIFS